MSFHEGSKWQQEMEDAKKLNLESIKPVKKAKKPIEPNANLEAEPQLTQFGKWQVISDEREYIKKLIQSEIDLEVKKHGPEVKGSGYVLGLIRSMSLIDELF